MISYNNEDGELPDGTTKIYKNISLQENYGCDTPAMWNSRWLSRLTLTGIGTVFVGVAVALLVLWVYNVRDDGFTLVTVNHYTWTYGPTAVLVIVVAFWRQVDFQCKAIAPWAVLYKDPGHASQTILLDYISPMQASSLWTSLKNRHFIVAAGITGFILLKVITLISTGLFILTPTRTRQSSLDLIQTSRFDGSSFNASSFVTLNDSSLVYTAYGILAAGLASPEGTSDILAYESFVPPHGSNKTGTQAVTASVKALVPAFNCESAPINMNLQPANTTDQHPADNIELLFPECQLLPDGDGIAVYALNPQRFKCPTRQLSPLMQRIDCFNQSDTATADNWQLLTLADIRYNQTLTGSDESSVVGDFVQASTWSTAVIGLTGIACRSSYSIETVKVTYDYSQSPAKVTVVRPATPSNERLDGFTDSDLGRLFTASLSAASDMFGNVLDNAYAEEYPNTIFKMMAQVASNMNGQTTGAGYEALLDEATMIAAAETVFRYVAVQIVKKNLMQESQLPLVGQAYYDQERLQMNDVSLWCMIAGFAFMTLLVAFLLLKRDRDVVPRDPGSIISAPLVLRNSKVFHTILKGSSASSMDQLLVNLRTTTFTTTTKPSQDNPAEKQFVLSANGSTNIVPRTGSDSELGWWKPLAAHRAFILATLGMPLVIVTALEILQHKSDSDSGIGAVSDVESLSSKILTRYLPALVMLLVASLFDSLDFTIAVLAPYVAMKIKTRSSKFPRLASVLGLMPFHALWTAFHHRYWGAFFAGSAALLGSVLTIVSSGLYTIDPVPSSSATQLMRTDSFTTAWGNSVLNDSGAAVLLSLSESLNLTYPRFTYEELALPRLQHAIDQAETATDDSNATISVHLPSFRASLNCTSLRASQFNLTTSYNPKVGPGATIRAAAPLPQSCHLGGSGGNLTTIEFEQSFQFPYTQNSSYVAKMLNLHVGPFDPVHELSEGELSPSTQKDNPPGCPSLGFLYGFVDVNDKSRSQATALMCYQQMEQLPVEVTLVQSDLSISLNTPPIPDESEVKVLASGPNGETAFQYRIQVHMDRELSLFNQTEYDSSGTGTSTVDRFFQGVLFGKTPIPQAWLADVSHAREVMSAIQAFYRRYMAQAISANLRVPSLASEAALLNGTLTNYNGILRVRQNAASKITLQILLGLMFACGTLAVGLSTLRKIVPHNPCTIAGVMMLWAGSKFCETDADGEDIPFLSNGAEFMSDKELMRRGVLEGWSFRIGWWQSDHGSRYGVDVVRHDTEKDPGEHPE
ncbi:hypothetical protein CLCR_01041 [Cladophialophora carrionii]|uniref:Uncharacterized protein n=1 Tax=Cladophialophora carrionii TaxID=86049 RepID=A0A1C1CD99_9EURO|nr:hypothetical protein CLCR_01041 [Cladophialophora carrionii]